MATSNAAVNQVPADGTAWLDIRYPLQDTAIAGRTRDEVAAFLRTLTGDRVEVLVDAFAPPHHADPERAEVRLLRGTGSCCASTAARMAGSTRPTASTR